MGTQTKTNITKVVNQRERSRVLFYISIVTLPLIQFAIFYFYINFDSLRMSFFSYQGFEEVFCGFDNFVEAWGTLSSQFYMISNSIIKWAISTLIGFPLSLFFSYYIFKKYFASGFFKVILFLPNVISPMIFAMVFKYMVTDLYPIIVESITGVKPLGLLDDLGTQFGTMIFYCIWSNFGVSMLMYSNAMSGVSKEILESGELDGTNVFTEFFFLILPSIYPTITSMTIIGLTTICSDQFGLHAMYGTHAPGKLVSIGYYLFLQQQYLVEGISEAFGILSALGLILSFFAVPIILLARKALYKFGPKED